jgi:serine protease Do
MMGALQEYICASVKLFMQYGVRMGIALRMGNSASILSEVILSGFVALGIRGRLYMEAPLRRPVFVSLLAVFVCTGCITPGSSRERVVLHAKNKVAKSLVHIRPVKEVFSEGKREEIVVVGSGFIITADGYVVTNEHVAGKSTSVMCVLYNKEELEAKVIGIDPFTDIALLKLESDRKDFPFVRLGSSKNLEAGQTVLALGSPHGLARSVSLGIISVTDRYLEGAGDMVSPFNTWIQTDAAINPGNSGGPLVNLKGDVVGVNARKLGGADNVGFAIPIDIAKEVIAKLRKDGRVARSWIGANFQEMTQRTTDVSKLGVIIGDVDPLSPAQEAQVRPGDVLLSVDGVGANARFEEDLPAIRKLIADKPVGSTITLTIQRGEEKLDVPVKTIERAEMAQNEVEFKEWGFTAADITPGLARLAQLPSTEGFMVSGTQVGGVADNAGLQRGDIVLAVDAKKIDSLPEFKKTYRELVDAKKHFVLLNVKQGALNRFVLIKQDGGSTAGESGGDTQRAE